MNFRLTAVLFVAVVVFVAALLVTALTDEDSALADAGIVPALSAAGLKDKDVDTVEIVRTQPTEEKLVFMKAGEKWALKEPHPAKGDGFQIDRIVSELFTAKPTAYPELSTNLSNHGLSPASVRVTLKSGEKTATVNVGETSRGGDKSVTFVTSSDRPDRPIAVKRSDLTALFRDGTRNEPGEAAHFIRWLGDLRDRRVLGGSLGDPATELTGLKLTAGGKDLALTHKAGGPWTFTAPAGYGEADLNGASGVTPDVYTGIRPLLTALAGLQANGPDDFIENPGDLSKYGLNPGNPNLVRVEFTPLTGSPEVLFLGGKVEENGKPTMPAKVYAQVEGDPAVVKLTTDKVDMVRNTVARPGELQNKDLLAENLKDRIDAIDVTASGQTAKLRKVTTKDGRRWLLYGGLGDPQEANQAAVQNLIESLTKPRLAKEVLAAPYDAAFDPKEQKATLKVWAGGVPTAKADGDKLPAEPAPTGNPIELVFGLKDQSGALVRRTAEGVKTDLKVPETVFAAAAKPRVDYLDVKLKSFNPADATKFVLKHGTVEKTVVLKDGDKWTFEEPAARKGKTADVEKMTGLLMVLSGLFPGRVLAEQPTPDDLKKWGLDPADPRIKAVVGIKDGEVVYEFGNETDDKHYVAARQNGGLVFAVPKVTADRLLSEDLRDRTLYRIEPDKVTGLKIRGWKGPGGAVQTVEFEKKGADWVAKSPPTAAGFVPDMLKVNALLAALAAPRAEAFVGPGKPEYGMDVDKTDAALEFTIIFPAPTPAVTLVLGGPAPGGLVYAASSAVPGEAVTFNSSAIRPLAEKPELLKK